MAGYSLADSYFTPTKLSTDAVAAQTQGQPWQLSNTGITNTPVNNAYQQGLANNTGAQTGWMGQGLPFTNRCSGC